MSGPRGFDRLDDLFAAAGEHQGEHRALIVLGVAGLALALVLAAFFVGRGFADSAEQAAGQSGPPPRSDADSLADAAVGGSLRERTASPAPSRSASPAAAPRTRTAPNGRLLGAPYRGPVRSAPVRGAAATCRAESSVDAGGNKVTYPARNMLDNVASTAWRCTGNGRGVTLTFRLAGPQRIAEVGLVPGYAKTDPFNGTDRYAENRRISRVRWTFDGGAWAEQRFRTTRAPRGLQTMRIPPVRTRKVTVTIQDSSRARRNTVAASAVRLAGPRR